MSTTCRPVVTYIRGLDRLDLGVEIAIVFSTLSSACVRCLRGKYLPHGTSPNCEACWLGIHV